MASTGNARTLRIALLIVASWIAVAALSGLAVYRIMRHEAAVSDEPAAWESGAEAARVADPSQSAVRDDLESHPRAARGGTNGVSGADDRAVPETPGSTSAVEAATESAAHAPTPQQVARQLAEHRAAAAAQQRAEARQQFQEILSGRASWSGLTPAVLGALTQEDIAAGLKKVEAMPWGPEANRSLQNLLRRWAEMDPRAAADYALGLESNRAGSNAIRSIWGAWADADPGSALDWYFAHANENPAMMSGTLRTAFMHLAEQDMARALATAWQLPEALGREALKAIVSQASLDGGLESLRTVVASMVPGRQRNQMVAAIVQEYAVYQPDEAVRWINMLDDPLARNTAVNQLVEVWGFDRPGDAARWVAAVPDPALQGRSAATLIRTWSTTEPEEAGRWLASLAPARTLDAALEQYVRNTMTDRPAAALDFVARVTDEKRRRQLAISVGRSWAQRDPTQARAYFQASSWDASVRNRFL